MPGPTRYVTQRRGRPVPRTALIASIVAVLAPALVIAADEPAPAPAAAVVSSPEPDDSVASGGVTPSLRQAVLTALDEALETKGSTFSRDLLAAIAARTGLSDQAVTTGLRDLLGQVEAHRKAKDDTWQALTALGGDDLDADDADRVLRQFLDWGEKAAKGKASYGLALVVERAADKAKVANWQARDLLARAVDLGLSGAASPGSTLPEKVGILVTGTSTYEVYLDKFAALMVKRDDEDELDKLRDLHAPIARRVAELLPEIPEVKWAIYSPNPNLTPDCLLRFEVDEFGVVDTLGPLPRVAQTIRFSLARIGDPGSRLYSHLFDVTYDYTLEEDEEVQALRLLDGVVEKAAVTLADEVGHYFALRRATE